MSLPVSAAACEDERWVTVDDTLLEIHNDLELKDQDNADECKRICMQVCYTHFVWLLVSLLQLVPVSIMANSLKQTKTVAISWRQRILDLQCAIEYATFPELCVVCVRRVCMCVCVRAWLRECSRIHVKKKKKLLFVNGIQ